jgi:hypothetical protein
VGDQRDMGNPAIHDSLDGFWWENLQENPDFYHEIWEFPVNCPNKTNPMNDTIRGNMVYILVSYFLNIYIIYIYTM